MTTLCPQLCFLLFIINAKHGSLILQAVIKTQTHVCHHLRRLFQFIIFWQMQIFWWIYSLFLLSSWCSFYDLIQLSNSLGKWVICIFQNIGSLLSGGNVLLIDAWCWNICLWPWLHKWSVIFATFEMNCQTFWQKVSVAVWALFQLRTIELYISSSALKLILKHLGIPLCINFWLLMITR